MATYRKQVRAHQEGGGVQQSCWSGLCLHLVPCPALRILCPSHCTSLSLPKVCRFCPPSPSPAQAVKLRLLLRQRGLRAVRVGTVDDYQVQEVRGGEGERSPALPCPALPA